MTITRNAAPQRTTRQAASSLTTTTRITRKPSRRTGQPVPSESLIGRKVFTILLQRAHHSLRIYNQERCSPHRNHVNLLENVLDQNSPLQKARNDYHRLLQEKDELMDDENYEGCMVIMHAIGSCELKIHLLDHTNPISAPPTQRRYESVSYPAETHDKDMRNSSSIP